MLAGRKKQTEKPARKQATGRALSRDCRETPDPKPKETKVCQIFPIFKIPFLIQEKRLVSKWLR